MVATGRRMKKAHGFTGDLPGSCPFALEGHFGKGIWFQDEQPVGHHKRFIRERSDVSAHYTQGTGALQMKGLSVSVALGFEKGAVIHTGQEYGPYRF